MDITELLANFADPAKIKSLPFYDLLIGGLITTALGMGVTFVALIALQFVSSLFGKLSVFKDPPTREVPKKPVPARAKTPVAPSSALSEELVAAITAALAMMLETPASNFRIRSIRKTQDSSSAWWRLGIIEQVQNRL